MSIIDIDNNDNSNDNIIFLCRCRKITTIAIRFTIYQIENKLIFSFLRKIGICPRTNSLNYLMIYFWS